MEALGNDRWRGEFPVARVGEYLYTVAGWIDHFDTWRSRGLNPSGNVGPSTWDRLIVTLSRGNSGPAVRAVQHNLRFAYGFLVLPVTGNFGPQTQAAVKAFQRGSRLPVTGVVNSPTWMTIIRFES